MAPADWQKEAIRCQTEWSKILQSWKYFENEDDLVKTYLGICLFGFVESEEVGNSSLRTYHLNYKESQRAHIGKIFAHLVSLSGHKIELGHTFLYLNENGIVYCVFRFRIKGRIFFIEPSGRFYNSWAHFLDTNELPACKFFAPENGVYTKSSKIVCYQTAGSQRMFRKSQNIMDWVCAVAGIGCTILGVFSIAPGVVAGTAIAVGAKNMHKAISNFLDQEEHRQLNTLGSVNGAISLAAVAVSALAGASKTYEMISLAGEHGLLSLKILQSLNFTSRLIDAGYFGTYLLHLSYVSQKGKISSVDALELSAQIFMLYGGVVNVEHLRNVINREEKITKYDLSCKFNDWKYKLNKSGVRVKDCSPLIGLKLLASRCKNPLQILLKFYSKDELILNTCYDSEHFTIDYLCDKISLNQFCLEMRPLFANFSYFFNDYYEEFGNIVRYYATPIVEDAILANDYKDICKLINYAISIIKKIDPDNELEVSEKVIVSQPASVGESEEITENYKVIIDVAKRLVSKKNVFLSVEQVVKSCQDSIQFTTTKLTEMITDSYNSIVEFNHRVVGEDRLQVILERVHATTVDEFFHHREAFRNIANKFQTENESLPGNEFVPINPSRLPTHEVEEISDRVMTLYESAYATATDSKKLSLQDTMNTLRNVAMHWTEKLMAKINTPFSPSTGSSSTLYSELNARLAVMSVDNSVNMRTFRKISKELEPETRSVVSNFPSVKDFVVVTNDRKFVRNDSHLCEALVAITCNFFNRIVDTFNASDNGNKITLLRKVFHFVITKFLEILADDEACEKISKKHDNGSHCIFSLYPKSRFYSVIQNFNDVEFLNELTAEFQNCIYDDEWSYSKIDAWKSIIDSDQFCLRIIRCDKVGSEEFYKTVSSKLFDIKVDHEYDVTINVNSVFLQSLRKFIIFSFVDDCDAIVTSLNLKLNI